MLDHGLRLVVMLVVAELELLRMHELVDVCVAKGHEEGLLGEVLRLHVCGRLHHCGFANVCS
jgi:hypothetical protein